MGIRRSLGWTILCCFLILAGCGSKATAPTPKSPPKTDTVDNTKQPIILGAIIGLSGRLEELGRRDRAAMEIVVDQINAAGGVLGRPLQLKFFEEQSEPSIEFKDGKADDVFAFLGFESSDTALRWYPALMQRKKILMISGAGSPALTDAVAQDPQTNKYLFRNGNHARDWAQTAAVFLRDIHKAKTYYYLSQGNAFGQSVEVVLAELMKPHGVTQVGASYFVRDEKKFADILRAIQAAKPDVIVSYLGTSAVPFAQLYSQDKVEIPVFDIAANSYEQEDNIQKELGAKADYINLSLFAWDSPITAKTQPFYAAFKQKAGTAPGGLFDIRAGDAVAILADAIKQAGAVDTDKVLGVLEKESFAGAAGTYKFDQSHQAMWGPNYLSGLIGQYQNGSIKVLWPENLKTAPYAVAPWWKK